MPAWFSNGVADKVQGVFLNNSPELYATVCQPHNCGHHFKIFYYPELEIVNGVYYTDPEIGPQRAILFGLPSQNELAYIQKVEILLLGHPLIPANPIQSDKAKSGNNVSIAEQGKQVNTCDLSNSHSVIRVESDILENKKSIHFYESVIQHEQDAAQYSGFVDKEKMYNSGQAIAQLKQANASNFIRYKKFGGAASTIDAVVLTPDPCATLEQSLKNAVQEQQARNNQIAHDAIVQRNLDEQAQRYSDKENHAKKMQEIQANYPQVNFGINPCNLNRSGDNSDIKKEVTFLVAINERGEVIEADIEKSSGISSDDDNSRAALKQCKVHPAIVNGMASTSWSHMTVEWYVPDNSHSLYQ